MVEQDKTEKDLWRTVIPAFKGKSMGHYKLAGNSLHCNYQEYDSFLSWRIKQIYDTKVSH